MPHIRTINNVFSVRNIDVTLVRDDKAGSFYVYGDAVDYAYSTTIGVYRLNHLTLEQWIDRIERIVQDSKDRAP